MRKVNELMSSRPLLINHFRKNFNEKREKVINIFTTFSISHEKNKKCYKNFLKIIY